MFCQSSIGKFCVISINLWAIFAVKMNLRRLFSEGFDKDEELQFEFWLSLPRKNLSGRIIHNSSRESIFNCANLRSLVVRVHGDTPFPSQGDARILQASLEILSISGKEEIYENSNINSVPGYTFFTEEAGEMNTELIDINIKAEAKGGYHDWAKVVEQCRGQSAIAKQALVLRAYENYTWGLDDIRNVRALIVELALNPEPKKRYDVHLLLEVHTRNSSYAMSEKERLAILQRSIPREFWSLTTLWSEEEMTWLYPNLPGKFLNHMIPTSSYRSCFMPVQVFSKNHPQYDFIWNWEMDTRSTQEYGETLDKIAQYANQAPIDHLLEKQTRWHIPASSKFGDRFEANEGEADLVTLNPFFNANNGGYYWAYDYQSE